MSKFNDEKSIIEIPKVVDALDENQTHQDVFSDEESHDIHYKTLSWQASSRP
ncbi:hypothetical protein PHLCEN_2v5301 [Hermanssonia centrifuga]|uniref:Uncharacterized protein n=1 Tax=Hermanssonia centrifuga TaxID=98765 RepID=A0A2R6P5H4_9APHY|nr:hypothetical protein PHLCEN_2v5301 [Hermanssonia centrifuga]